MSLYKRLTNIKLCLLVTARIGSEKMSIIHMDQNHWKWSDSNGQSQYPHYAKLNSVCWLQIGTTFLNHPPGQYKIVWRMNLPSDDAGDFRAVWGASIHDGETHISTSEFTHEKAAPWTEEVIGKGWVQLCFGIITIPPGSFKHSVHVSILGGNEYWFHNLMVDYVELSPMPRGASILSFPEIHFEEEDTYANNES